MKPFIARLSIILVALIAHANHASPIPRVTVFFVVDQLAQEYMERLEKHFRHGLRYFLHHGMVYKNAHFPHATPCTAAGHAGLNTGAWPSYHGIIANHWASPVGKKIYADEDNSGNASVFAPDGSTTYNFGKSAHHIMADGISDQFILSQSPCQKRYAYALSIKSRSSILAASHMGKAVWFDNKSGNFTSSKAYFDELPDWLVTFNQEAWHKSMKEVTWKLRYPCDSCAYDYYDIDCNTYGSRTDHLVGKTLAMSSCEEKPYDLFIRTPAANQLLLDLAYACIEEHVHYHDNEQLLLWISLSSLDAVGHDFGPHSREVIDMIYHLDKQLECFMHDITQLLKRRDFFYVLTADHGVSQIPELMCENGYKGAKRIQYSDMIAAMNKEIKKHFGLDDMIVSCQSNQFYCNKEKLNALEFKKQRNLIAGCKRYLQSTSLFKNVWTAHELQNLACEPFSYEAFYKNQYFFGRSGDIIVQPFPYQPLIEYPHGSTHRTCYESDTRVPLILYQKSYFEKRVVYDRVWTLQLANTLAHILHIPPPSASPFPLLPGVIEYDPITGEAIQPVVL